MCGGTATITKRGRREDVTPTELDPTQRLNCAASAAATAEAEICSSTTTGTRSTTTGGIARPRRTARLGTRWGGGGGSWSCWGFRKLALPGQRGSTPAEPVRSHPWCVMAHPLRWCRLARFGGEFNRSDGNLETPRRVSPAALKPGSAESAHQPSGSCRYGILRTRGSRPVPNRALGNRVVGLGDIFDYGSVHASRNQGQGYVIGGARAFGSADLSRLGSSRRCQRKR